ECHSLLPCRRPRREPRVVCGEHRRLGLRGHERLAVRSRTEVLPEVGGRAHAVSVGEGPLMRFMFVYHVSNSTIVTSIRQRLRDQHSYASRIGELIEIVTS